MNESWLSTTIALAAAVLVSACATPAKMGLTKDTQELDTSTKSILLMTMRLDHAAKPSVTPNPRVVHVEMPNAQSREQRLNFLIDGESATLGPDGTEYFVRMELPPGKYKLMGVSGGGGIAIFPGHFLLPLVTEFEVPANSVAYMGRIEARTRDRKENEFRAGPVLPLLDQAMTGWSGSTWDVAIRDSYESDMGRFKTAFPALRSASVKKNVVSFDRAVAQAWWDAQ